MLNFEGAENLQLVLLFIVPGLIALFVRSRFIAGRTPSLTENALAFFFLSIVYYSVAVVLLPEVASESGLWRWLLWVALLLVGPALFGLMLGIAAQKEWASWLAGKLGLEIMHIIPTAWDWRFSRVPRGGMFILVTLTNDEKVAGYFGPRSFASSDSGERDLYIEEEYTVDQSGNWTARPERVGVLIPMREIRYIEYWQPN